MLRMSKLADYGTVVMTYLAQEPQRVCSATEIAGAVGLELPTVSKLLKLLLHAGLLISHRGSKGGYGLAHDPRGIAVADIIDAIEGYPMGFTECSSVPGLCTRELSCSVRANWQRISRSIREILEQVTLAELAQPLPQTIGLEHALHFKAEPRAVLDESLEVQHEHHDQTTG